MYNQPRQSSFTPQSIASSGLPPSGSSNDFYTPYSGQMPGTSGSVPQAAKPGDGSTPTDVVAHIKRMPLLLTGAIVLYFLAAPITALQEAPFGENTGQFMVKQLVMNSSLLIIFSALYGMMVQALPKSGVAKYQNVLLPIVLIATMWFKSYMTYRSGLTTHCTQAAQDGSGGYQNGEAPYMQSTLLWNTSKVPIAILVTYLFVILFPQTMTPFFQFFSGDEDPHPLIMYFAIGFWTGCAAWASEASCYFQLVRSGCRPFDNIRFETIAAVEEEDGGDD